MSGDGNGGASRAGFRGGDQNDVGITRSAVGPTAVMMMMMMIEWRPKP